MNNERFSDPGLLILTSLAGCERHGYGIMEDIKTVFGISIGPGSLYGALARLEERGLIESVAGELAQARRRPYRLTGRGTTVLREELERLSRLTTVGIVRLEGAATT